MASGLGVHVLTKMDTKRFLDLVTLLCSPKVTQHHASAGGAFAAGLVRDSVGTDAYPGGLVSVSPTDVVPWKRNAYAPPARMMGRQPGCLRRGCLSRAHFCPVANRFPNRVLRVGHFCLAPRPRFLSQYLINKMTFSMAFGLHLKDASSEESVGQWRPP
jgi:hypothetical protein